MCVLDGFRVYFEKKSLSRKKNKRKWRGDFNFPSNYHGDSIIVSVFHKGEPSKVSRACTQGVSWSIRGSLKLLSTKSFLGSTKLQINYRSIIGDLLTSGYTKSQMKFLPIASLYEMFDWAKERKF
jgi:hypothetical protein